MTISKIEQVVVETTTVKGINTLRKRSVDLALSLDAGLEFRAYVNVEKSDSPEMLVSYADQLMKFQELLASLLELAAKKGVSCKASVLSKPKPVREDDGQLRVYRFGELEARKSATHLSLVLFENSRARNHFERMVIVADSDLDADREHRLNSWCSYLSKAKIPPRVAVIQGKSHFHQWESFFAKSCLQNVVLDILERQEDLSTYIKKSKARVIGLPFQQNHYRETLSAFHDLNRADILLF